MNYTPNNEPNPEANASGFIFTLPSHLSYVITAVPRMPWLRYRDGRKH